MVIKGQEKPAAIDARVPIPILTLSENEAYLNFHINGIVFKFSVIFITKMTDCILVVRGRLPEDLVPLCLLKYLYFFSYKKVFQVKNLKTYFILYKSILTLYPMTYFSN
jgi:hypothetical protein